MSSERYLADIHAQPDTLDNLTRAYASGDLRQALRRAASILRSSAYPCLTGMGASYFALLAARPSFDRTGCPVRLEDTGYLLDYGLPSVLPDQPVLLVSQSGQSIEPRLLMEQLPAESPVVLITNDPASELAARADIVLPLLAAPDESVALKTYTATVALLLMLAAEAADGSAQATARALVGASPMTKAIEQSERLLGSMMNFALPISYVPVLGQGASIASACAAALLIKETAKLPAEGFNGGQFRHGAIEVVTEGMLTILFAPAGRADRLNRQLERELARAGARLMAIGDRSQSNESSNRFVIEIGAPDEYLAPVFEVVPVQLLSHALASQRGVEPGSFTNTVPVIASLEDLGR
jgi:glucosamine--fructose-6-phosphate aminotransferase (isomerizing)